MGWKRMTAAAIFMACSAGFANQAAHGQSATRAISRMFLDARAPDLPVYNHSEMERMSRDASNSDDFGRLADYFDYRSMEFEQKSQDQLKELERLLALPYHARSYPAQVDSTRELIKHYRTEAQKYSARANAWRERATDGDDAK
jgi:hypothetical protein